MFHRTNSIELAKEEIANHKFEYFQLEGLIVNHLGDGMFTIVGVPKQLRFSVYGAGYLSERARHIQSVVFTSCVLSGDWNLLERLINDLNLNQKIVLAVLDDHIMGVMSSYNPVPHVELLDALAETSFSEDISSITLSDTHMSVFVRVPCPSIGFDLGITIVNGHTGHKALRFLATITSNTWELTGFYKFKAGRARHLSNVRSLVAKLGDAIQELHNLKIEDRLMNITTAEVKAFMTAGGGNLTTRQEFLFNHAEKAGLANGVELVSELAVWKNTMGYGAAVDSLLTAAVKLALQ